MINEPRRFISTKELVSILYKKKISITSLLGIVMASDWLSRPYRQAMYKLLPSFHLQHRHISVVNLKLCVTDTLVIMLTDLVISIMKGCL